MAYELKACSCHPLTETLFITKNHVSLPRISAPKFPQRCDHNDSVQHDVATFLAHLKDQIEDENEETREKIEE